MRDCLIHRPLVVAAIGLVLGVAAIHELFACLLVLGAIAFVREVRAGVACSVAFLVGCLISPPATQNLASQQWLDANVRVASVPRMYSTESVAEVSVAGTRLMMSAPTGAHLVLGEVVHVRGVAKPLSEGSQALLNRGIVGRMRPTMIQEVAPAPWLYRAGEAWRESFAAFCERWLPAQAAAETEAVCFNISSALDPASKQALMRSGTVHIVAASGLHVGLIALALFWLLSLFPIPRWLQILILTAALVLYSAASGLHPPVVRASIMAITLSAAFMFRREPDMLSALALAAVFQILWDPRAVLDAGFQLSFVVVAAFALFSMHLRTAKSAGARLKEAGLNALKGTALATLASAPLVAYVFGTVSITSIAANLGIALVLPVLVLSAMAAHLSSFLFPALGIGVMTGLVAPLAGWLGYATDSLGGSWASLPVPAFSGYWLLVFYGLMLLIWRPRLRPA